MVGAVVGDKVIIGPSNSVEARSDCFRGTPGARSTGAAVAATDSGGFAGTGTGARQLVLALTLKHGIVATVGATRPAGQRWHLAAPRRSATEPGGHGVHDPRIHGSGAACFPAGQ